MIRIVIHAAGIPFVADTAIQRHDCGHNARICETVYAWLDTSDVKLPDLPEGVDWEED